MYRRTQNYLFFKGDLVATLEAHIKKAQEKVDEIPREQFLVSSDDDIFEHIKSDTIVNAIFFDEDSKVANYEEIQIDGQSQFIDTPLRIPGIRVTVSIPYSGDPALWDLRPSSGSGSFPTGIKRKSSKGEYLDIVIEQRISDPKEQIQIALDRNINLIKEYLANQKLNIDTANAKLDDCIRKAIRERRDRLEKHEGVVRMLGIPLVQKEGVPSLKPITLERKVIKPIPPVPKSGYMPEYGITDEQYENILAILRHEGRTYETTSDTYESFDEYKLRNMLLGHLNGHFKGDATGETFRGKGKTDVRVEFESRAAFVAECKIWRGTKELTEAIDQMLGYLTWRDCKSALIIFNKDNAKFTELLEKIPNVARSHPCFHREIKQQEDGEWRFVLKSKEDEARRIITQVLVFNLYMAK